MKKKQLTMWATSEEIASIETVKKFYARTTISDTLRFLILKEAKKILNENISIGYNASKKISTKNTSVSY